MLSVPTPSYRFLSTEEARKLVGAAEGYWRALIVFLLHTGCRFGEAAGLRWDDLELEAPLARVRVQRAAWQGIVGPTKNGRTREIPLTPDALEALPSLPRSGDFVFALRDGTLPTPAEACAYLHRICDRASIKRISWHVLRHMFATELSSQNVPIRVIQELLGHASIMMTARYAHVADQSLQDATGRLPSVARAVERREKRLPSTIHLPHSRSTVN